ncbi:MAG: Clp1/GlmU family protein [Candidatus Bathyarchaeia archaeon]
MRQKIERGKTLLVDGPANVIIHLGAMKAFGARIGAKEHVVVKFGKRIPLEAVEDSEVDILLGEKASYEIIDGSPIPPSWEEVSEKIFSFSDKVKVAVLGATDSGKSSFSTYLVNMALSRGLRVALIDGDLGQSDLGPPGTLGLSILKRFIIDPSDLQPDHIIFIGITSPQNVVSRVINGLMGLRDKALSIGPDMIVINTDGWVDGEEAINYKRQLIKALEPTFTVIMHGRGNLTPLVSSLSENNTIMLLAEIPEKIKKRDRETRKAIRESLYKRYLRDARIRSVPLSWVKLYGNFAIKGKLDLNQKKRLEEILGDKIVYCESFQDHVVLVLKSGVVLSDEEKNKISAELSKPVKIIFEGSERGLLVSLEDNNGRFLGIGTIHSIDYERGAIKIYTNTEKIFSKVHVGLIRLDERGNEVEVVRENALRVPPQRDITP